MSRKKPSFHKDFKVPTKKERSDALGSFPFEDKANASREEMLLSSARLSSQPSLQYRDKSDAEGLALALSDLNNRKLYIPTSRSETSFAIPQPKDEMDWLSQVPEDGQSFDEYVSFLTTRKTGRIRPIANANGHNILLLPIVRVSRNNSLTGPEAWPAYAPPLSKLVEYTQTFFDRQVQVLPNAQLLVSQSSIEKSFTESKGKKMKAKKQKITHQSLGAFASATTKGKFKLSFPKDDEGQEVPITITGRADLRSGRVQFQVTSLLNELSTFRHNHQHKSKASQPREDFCIMGITMEDLYDGPKDLFCAGMAFGGSKVAIFSFARYHPFLKMSPLHWHRYCYVDKCDGYSYFENDEEPDESKKEPPNILPSGANSIENKDDIEFLRRSTKLLIHELGHLYGLDHCIHNRCLMMGTGHLVEDFRAPSHLCGVCLRKLQWRLGFDVKRRYKSLVKAFELMGMTKESQWCNKQFKSLEGNT